DGIHPGGRRDGEQGRRNRHGRSHRVARDRDRQQRGQSAQDAGRRPVDRPTEAAEVTGLRRTMSTSFYAPAFDVKVEGLTLAANVSKAVIELEYDNNIDTADMFTLKLNNADLSLTDSALFDVGKTVEIHLGYANDLYPMMLGEITAVNPVFPQ